MTGKSCFQSTNLDRDLCKVDFGRPATSTQSVATRGQRCKNEAEPVQAFNGDSETMQTRPLGASGFEVTCIGLGTNYVGGHGLYTTVDEAEGVRLVQRALDLGVTFIDTADIYGFGRSEELVGKAIAGRRESVFIATKGGNSFSNGERTGVNNEPAYLRSALEASLRRLGTDHVDLYYIHRYDERTPPEESFGALMRMKEDGLIRSAGVSNFGPEQLRAALQAGPIDALQSRYNLLQREVEEEVLPLCVEHNIGFIPWGPLAFGLLGGRYARDFVLPEGDWRLSSGLFHSDSYAAALDVVDALKPIAADRNVPLAHLATQWLLSRPAIVSVIAGAKTVAQVEENAAADSLALDADDIARINALL
jgi:myo-inositol catabolism protein IolS